MSSTLPHFHVLQAPSAWQVVDFISDLHLQVSDAATFDAWQRYMHDTRADAVFILGDLMEVWAGDDIVQQHFSEAANSSFETRCAAVLRAATQRKAVFFMRGNRDFLIGTHFLNVTSVHDLHDPTALDFAGHRYLLTHGDALCVDDLEYMQFRVEVRTAQWQESFLKKPLQERIQIARTLRAQSEARKKSGTPFVDIDSALANDWLAQAQCTQLIHGHTHLPADAPLGTHTQRHVLSDWDLQAQPPRAQVLRLDAQGLQRMALK